MGIEALVSTQIIDTTAVGRAVMTAADAAAARTAIGAGTSSFSGAYSALSGIPSTFAPSAHKTSHATGGSDALTAADIGAAATSHTHAAADITSGIIATARLATGTANSTTYLRGDQTWQAIAAGGISSLNALTDATQTFATGTTGTNFGVVSTAGVHTFNLPDASAIARGVVTTGAQTFAGAKTFSGNITGQGNLALPGNGGLATWQNDGLTFQGGARLVGRNNGIECYLLCQNGPLVGFTNAAGVVIGGQLGFEANYGGTGNPDVVLVRQAANTLALRRSTASQIFQVFNTYTNDSNLERLALQFVTYASARYAQLACESAGTGIANMNLVLSPKGTGALIAGPMPDGTAVGGNARGTNAVDLQIIRGAATQVAAGIADFQAGSNNTTNAGYAATFGQSNTNTGAYGFVSGQNNTNSATWGGTFGGFYSVASAFGAVTLGGIQANAYRRCMRAFAANAFTSVSPGDCQGAEVVLQGITTTNIPVELLISQSTRLTVPSGIICHFLFIVTGVRQGGADVAYYMRRATVKNIGGTVSLVGSVDTIGTDVATGTSLSITADNTNKAISVAPTGVLSQNWRWNCIVYGGELGHA